MDAKNNEAQILRFEMPDSMEVINGVRTRLGRMSLEQLLALEEGARQRAQEAQLDIWVITDFRERLFPGEGPDLGSAA